MNHLNHIAAKLAAYGLDGMVITSAPGEFYAIGLRGEGLVLVSQEQCWYSTDSRYIEVVSNQVTGCEIAMVENGHSHHKIAAERILEHHLVKIGYEEEYLSVGEFQKMQKTFPDFVEFVPASQLITELRACKDEDELAAMRKSQEITDRAFDAILNDIHPGVTEQEIAAKLVYYMLSFGAQNISFEPIVASGTNGSMPHAIPSAKKIQEGEFLTMDFGSLYNGYCSDMTRTVAVGEPTEEMRKVYETVKEAQLKCISMAKAGVIGADVHNAAEEVLKANGYGGKMGHGLGHSLGIEIHENPGFRKLNKNPMPLHAAVSVEPGIYLPGKFGVRIEDVVVLTEDGCEVLTKSPKELIVIP